MSEGEFDGSDVPPPLGSSVHPKASPWKVKIDRSGGLEALSSAGEREVGDALTTRFAAMDQLEAHEKHLRAAVLDPEYQSRQIGEVAPFAGKTDLEPSSSSEDHAVGIRLAFGELSQVPRAKEGVSVENPVSFERIVAEGRLPHGRPRLLGDREIDQRDRRRTWYPEQDTPDRALVAGACDAEIDDKQRYEACDDDYQRQDSSNATADDRLQEAK